MKKLFTKTILTSALALLLLLPGYDSNAQFGFAIGPKAGLTVSTFRGADVENIEARTNWMGGLFMNFQLSPGVTIQPEVLLTERGADVRDNNVQSSLSINYFEVPVLAKFRLPLANNVIFPHILLGPNFAFRTDLDLTSTDTQSGAVVETNTSDIRRTDIGALVGAGVDIQTRTSGVFFTLDGRYGFGFTNINKNDDAIELRNAGWMFAAGIGFRFGNNNDDDY